MANLSNGKVTVDTAYLTGLAASLENIAGFQMSVVQSYSNKARNHENWRCNERHNVTNEVDNIYQKSKKIIADIEKLAADLRNGAADFEAMQNAVISTLSVAELKSI